MLEPVVESQGETAITANTPEHLHDLLALSLRSGDVKTFQSIYEDTGILVDGDRQLIGPAAIGGAMREFIELGPSFQLIARTVLENNGVAMIHSTWCMTMPGPDGFEEEIKATIVARQQTDGTWKVAIDAAHS